ncbi:MAG TPA: hypothetical protein O0X39_02290 [Methanocorpusculum sp.]|nr:hypothetical protein [Methanocorpusculum sp.]
MRHEVLYQYDLPIEILDEIPRTEEVLEVIYARSPDKYLLPILFTRLRIVWAYPERETIYRIFEMNYVDLVDVHLKYPPTPALPAVLTINTVTGDKYTFRNIRSTVEQMRGALLTLRDIMHSRVGGSWGLQVKKSIISEEYILKETDSILSDINRASNSDADLFEDKPLPGAGCFEKNDELFSHFPENPARSEPRQAAPAASATAARAEPPAEVFEKPDAAEQELEEEAAFEQFREAKEAHLQRMIENAEPPKPKVETILPQDDDSIVMTYDSGKKDDQWERHDGGDAMILPGSRTRVGAAKYKHLEDAAEHYNPEDDDSEVYVSNEPKPPKKVIDPRNVDPITLEPRENFDDEAIDKTLASLKQLRETGLISDEEYKVKCLSLFKKTGL